MANTKAIRPSRAAFVHRRQLAGSRAAGARSGSASSRVRRRRSREGVRRCGVRVADRVAGSARRSLSAAGCSSSGKSGDADPRRRRDRRLPPTRPAQHRGCGTDGDRARDRRYPRHPDERDARVVQVAVRIPGDRVLHAGHRDVVQRRRARSAKTASGRCSRARRRRTRPRLIVRTPVDPKKFNGTVIVEWLNVTSGRERNAIARAMA